MKKDMPLEGLRWSRDSGSALYDTPQNGRSRTGWGVEGRVARYHGQQRVAVIIDDIATIATAYLPSAFLEFID